MAQEPVEKPWEITSPGYIKFRQMDPMLKTAATLGDVDFFTQAFTSDPPEYFRLRTSNKCNIFHIAVRLRRTAFITKAIEKLELIDLHELLTQQEASLKWNPLHFAAFQGNLEEIQLIHEVYKSIDAASIFVHDLPCLAADVNGKSPLHLALEKNEECALEILSMNTEKLCCLKDNEGRTPFLLAVQQGFTKIASKMLESNFKFDISNEDGLNPLQILAENSGTVAEFEESSIETILIKSHPDLLFVNSKNGQSSVLHTWAKTNRLVQLAAVAVNHGLDYLQKLSSSVNSEGNTSVHLAVEHGNEDFALFIIKRCGLLDPPIWRYENKDGVTPFDIALRKRQGNFVLRCITQDSWTYQVRSKSSEESRLFIAVKEGMNDAVQNICDYVAADPSLQTTIPTVNCDGQTVLHVVSYCTEKTGRCLVEMFPHLISLPDNNGERPFDIASKVCSKWLIELLLTKDPSAIETSPKAWIEACKRGDLEVIKVFAKNCDKFKEMKNNRDSYGQTPLHLALQRQDIVLAELLLKKGVDSSVSDIKGTTAKNLLADLSAQHYEWHELCQRLKINPLLKTRYIQDTGALEKMRDTLAVVAALLATLTFAAGFTLPGGLNQDNGEALLQRKISFIVFILADTYAMCCSMFVLFCLIWSMVCDDIQSHVLIDRSVLVLVHSFCATLVAFMTGIYTVVSQKSLWTPLLIIVMTSSVAVISFNKTVLYRVLDGLIPSIDKKRKEKLQFLKQIPGQVMKLTEFGGLLAKRRTSRGDNSEGIDPLSNL